jgi:hypothetical protein
MLYRAFVRLIYPVRGGFLLHEAGNIGGWPSICSGDREVNGMLEGDTPHVRTEYTPGVVVEAEDPNAEEGQIGTGNHCAEGVKEIEDAFYDARGKHLLTIVRYDVADAHADASANVELHVAGSDVVLAGGGCNESIPLSPDAGRVR